MWSVPVQACRGEIQCRCLITQRPTPVGPHSPQSPFSTFTRNLIHSSTPRKSAFPSDTSSRCAPVLHSQPAMAQAADAGGSRPQRVAVVGAGAAGLAAAYQASKSAEHEVTLFEATEHAGGHAWTVEVSGGVLCLMCGDCRRWHPQGHMPRTLPRTGGRLPPGHWIPGLQ